METIKFLIFIIGLLFTVLFLFELIVGYPMFISRYILLRDFKIALLTKLVDDQETNQQLYVIVGVTWFDIIISYQNQSSGRNLTNTRYYSAFVNTRKRWSRDYEGFTKYQEAKIALDIVQKHYLKKKYIPKQTWIGGLLKEDDI